MLEEARGPLGQINIDLDRLERKLQEAKSTHNKLIGGPPSPLSKTMNFTFSMVDAVHEGQPDIKQPTDLD
jgi:hypothetical protein